MKKPPKSNAAEILSELEALGNEGIKKMYAKNYGVKEPFFGVKIGDMKPIQKRIKVDYQLALDLYDSGNYDAMYFAAMIADDARMTKRDLQHWVNTAYGGWLPGFTVASVAAGGRYGWEIGLKWITSPKPAIAAAGWSTLGNVAAITDDADLDLSELSRLITQVKKSIHEAPDVVRYWMNNFVISIGCYVAPLKDTALNAAESIGALTADLGNNACKVPYAPDYIRKVEKRGNIGKKRKSVKC